MVASKPSFVDLNYQPFPLTILPEKWCDHLAVKFDTIWVISNRMFCFTCAAFCSSTNFSLYFFCFSYPYCIYCSESIVRFLQVHGRKTRFIKVHAIFELNVCVYFLVAAVIGIRLHWVVALSCVLMALYILILK